MTSDGTSAKALVDLMPLLAFDLAPVATAVTSLAGELLYANRAFRRDILDNSDGIPPRADIVAQCVGVADLAFIDTLARDGVPRSTEFTLRRPMAESRTFLCHASRVTDEHATPIYLLLVCVETTGFTRRETAEAAHLSFVQELMGVASWSLHLDDSVNVVDGEVRWSPAVGPLLQRRPSSIEKNLRRYLRFVHPDDRARLLGAIQTAIEEQSEYRVRYRLLSGDRYGAMMESRGRVIPDPESTGALVLYAFERNINEQVLLEEASAQREGLLRALLETEDFPIFAVDRRLRYTCFNSVYAGFLSEISGAPPAVGADCLESIPDDQNRRKVGAMLRRALAGESRAEELRGLTTLGRQFRYDCSYVPVHEQSRRLSGVVVMCRAVRFAG